MNRVKNLNETLIQITLMGGDSDTNAMRDCLLILLALAISGCATSSVTTPSGPMAVEPLPLRRSAAPTVAMDLEERQRSLGFGRAKDQLGYAEKAFYPCRSDQRMESANCEQHYLVLIHFQLMCRDSVGTISTALNSSDISPVAGQRVSWTLGKLRGSTSTDASGYGQILTSATQSLGGARLKLAVGPEFLYLRAREIQRIVAPQPWCNQ